MHAFIVNQEVSARRVRIRDVAKSLPTAAMLPHMGIDLRMHTTSMMPVQSHSIDKLAGSLRIHAGDLPLLAAAVSLLFLLGLFLPSFAPWAISRMVPLSLQATVEQDASFLHDVHHVYRNTPHDASLFRPYELQQYTVQQGDTISQISQQFHLNMDTLISVNNIENARNIRAGQALFVPDQDGIFYRVQSGDSLDAISRRYNISVNELLDKNGLQENRIREGDTIFLPGLTFDPLQLRLYLGELFLNPLEEGRYTSGFGYRADPFTGLRRFHYGIDFAAREGTAIVAASEGRIVHLGTEALGYGQYLIIRHNKEFQSLYAHFKDIHVKVGDYVKMGQVIGTVGNTGRSTGPHLHFSIIRSGKFVNPSQYLF